MNKYFTTKCFYFTFYCTNAPTFIFTPWCHFWKTSVVTENSIVVNSPHHSSSSLSISWGTFIPNGTFKHYTYTEEETLFRTFPINTSFLYWTFSNLQLGHWQCLIQPIYGNSYQIQHYCRNIQSHCHWSPHIFLNFFCSIFLSFCLPK